MTEHNSLPVDEPGPVLVHTSDRERYKRHTFAIFALLMLLGAALLLGYWWFDWRVYERTDDAFIDGYIASVSSQIKGQVVRILVNDNQFVRAGEVLVELDPRNVRNRLDQTLAARAVVAARAQQIEAEIQALEATLKQNQANIRLSQANLLRDREDHQRYQDSFPIAVSPSQLSTARAAAAASTAMLEANQQALAYTQAQSLKLRAALQENHSALKKADAEVANARLQLSYTQVLAPLNGYVTRRMVEQGNYVQPGATLLSVVSDKVWVTANFKETQLAGMKIGQPVEVRVDAYPQVRLQARIDSFQRGTGAVFSLLPAENATGNFVKIVQRVPVKIVFDDPRSRDYPLAPGLSVTLSVQVH